MKINLKVKEDVKLLKELEPGSLCSIDGEYYIITGDKNKNTSPMQILLVKLSNGELLYADEFKYVKEIKKYNFEIE